MRPEILHFEQTDNADPASPYPHCKLQGNDL